MRTLSDAIGPQDTLNQIITSHPEALPVLHEFGLDTCCGGALPLEEAARRHGLELDALLRALRLAVAV